MIVSVHGRRCDEKNVGALLQGAGDGDGYDADNGVGSLVHLKVRRGGTIKSKTATDVTLRRMSARWLDSANAVWEAVGATRFDKGDARAASDSDSEPGQKETGDRWDQDAASSRKTPPKRSSVNQAFGESSGGEATGDSGMGDADALRATVDKRKSAVSHQVSALFKLTESERCASRAQVDGLEDVLRSQALAADELIEAAKGVMVQLLEGNDALRERVRTLELQTGCGKTDADMDEEVRPPGWLPAPFIYVWVRARLRT